MNFLEKLQADRSIDVQFWKKHPELQKQLVDDAYPDKAHFIYELLQNAEDACASSVFFALHEDRLEFRHNGKRTFTERDIDAITDVSKSGKPDSGETIGKFGIGFKSVFKYTESPEIYSGNYSFRISDFIYPEDLPAIEGLGSDTLFIFPFNSARKLSTVAYDEIARGLSDLPLITLLFLANLENIGWELGKNGSRKILRVAHSDNHVEVLKTIGNKTTASSHFLRFSEPVADLPKQSVSIAFVLEFLPNVAEFDTKKALSKQLKIVPANPGRVAVFFPAEDENSELRFHLHAPFVPVLSRASIKETDANKPLFEQLAKLAADSLHTVRDLGLLSAEFLGVLPNQQDAIPFRYQPIQVAIINEMKNEPLTPTHSKSYAPAKHLLQAKASLKELLSVEDIEFLVDYDEEPPLWAVAAAQNNSNADRFLTGLAIRPWDVEEFIELLAEKTTTTFGEPDESVMTWLAGKSIEWHQQFYAFLYKELEPEGDLFRLEDLNIIRLSNGSYSVGSNCYLPGEGDANDDDLPRVDAGVYTSGKSKTQQAGAKRLLEEIGVHPVGEVELVQNILQQRYTAEGFLPDLNDLARFIALVEKEPAQAKMFAKYHIFERTDDRWGIPSQVFLDTPFLDTGLSDYYDALGGDTKKALSDSYLQVPVSQEKLRNFAVAVGVTDRLLISETSCHENPNRYELVNKAHGNWSRFYGINRDYVINGLKEILAQENEAISRLVWKTLCANKNSNILKARYRNNSHYMENTADSQLVFILRDSPWVPQKNGEFVRPSQASGVLLPEGFPFDEGDKWLKAIGFGQEELQRSEEEEKLSVENQEKLQTAKNLGFPDQDSLERAKKFAGLPKAEQERMLADAQRRQPPELPSHEPRNPDLRAERVEQQAADAPERVTEQRTRSVSVGRELVKQEAEQYLRQQYTNADGEMFCQACKAPLPFKLNDGSYYFENVEFLAVKNNLNGLKKRHQQNYLALCPNHSAMFQYANGAPELMKAMFVELERDELEVILAQENTTIYFTKTHIADLQKVIEVDGYSDEDGDETDDDSRAHT